MFDINEELDKIIYKYELDKHHPQYRIMKQCEKILKALIEELCEKKKKTLFICRDVLETNIIEHYAQDSEYIKNVVLVRRGEQCLKEINFDEYKMVYVFFYDDAQWVMNYLSSRNIINVWVYDIFEQHHIRCDRDFYKFCKNDIDKKFAEDFPGRKGWKNCVQLELYSLQCQCEDEQDVANKMSIIEKCLFLAVYMRDFILVEKYIKRLEPTNRIYREILDEINNLLQEIEDKVRDNTGESIIVYWLDAITYESSQDMSYLQSRVNKSVSFENAFTASPHTISTAKGMFFGKNILDDKVYSIRQINASNSDLLRYLDEKEYDVKVISGYMHWFEKSRVTKARHEIYDPSSEIFWDMLNNLINQTKKTFYIIHALVEGHAPYFSSNMSKDCMVDNAARYKVGKNELDKQLEYYDRLLGDSVTRIYMSDHGAFEFRTRYHIIFSIYSQKIRARKIKELFSTLDFKKLLMQLVDNEEVNEKEIAREYVEIQGMDRYNYKLISKLFKEKRTPTIYMLGYKGIITKENIYIRFNNGIEWLTDRNRMLYEPVLWNSINNIQESDKIPELRKMVTDYPMDVLSDDCFKYARYLRVLASKVDYYFERNISIICEVLNKYPEKSVAIRMGGNHSRELYTNIPYEYKKKIGCFIDKDTNCQCGIYGLPVITLEQLNEINIKAVVLSSYNHREMLRKESRSYPKNIDVIDFYRVFERYGIVFNDNFYMDIKMPDELYEGFPFEDES